MADSHVVRPNTDRITLSTGEYLDVKRELNAGEWWDQIAALAWSTALGREQSSDPTVRRRAVPS